LGLLGWRMLTCPYASSTPSATRMRLAATRSSIAAALTVSPDADVVCAKAARGSAAKNIAATNKEHTIVWLIVALDGSIMAAGAAVVTGDRQFGGSAAIMAGGDRSKLTWIVG